MDPLEFGFWVLWVRVGFDGVIAIWFKRVDYVNEIDVSIFEVYVESLIGGEGVIGFFVFVPSVVKSFGCFEMVYGCVATGSSLHVAAFAVEGKISVSIMSGEFAVVGGESDGEGTSDVISETYFDGSPVAPKEAVLGGFSFFYSVPVFSVSEAGSEISLCAGVDNFSIFEYL